MINEMFLGVFLSIVLGALIGVQREMRQQKKHEKGFAGFRAFTFISLFGYLAGYISNEINDYSILAISLIGFIGFAIYSYYDTTKKSKDNVSITTHLSSVITFLIGILVSMQYYYLSITIAILMATILSLGDKLHMFAKKLKNNEVFATLNFAIITVLVLPILPNKNFGFLDIPFLNNLLLQYFSQEILIQFQIFNPYNIWLMVVLISGITYVGYILLKVFGPEKGITLTGFLGGLMSSTALTSSFSIESKKYHHLANPLAIGVIIACSTMFFRIIVEVMVINPNLIMDVIIMSVMGMVGILIATYMFFKRKPNHKKQFEMDSPFSLGPAIKFACFFVIIIFFSKFFSLIFGSNGIYFVSFFSGFIDVDVITITLSKMALENTISETTATIGIFIAAFSNTLFKGAIAYFLGSREYSSKILKAFALIFIVGFLAITLLMLF